MTLAIGQRVRLLGLQSRSDLNGRFGVVVTELDDGRHGVAVDGVVRGGHCVGTSLTVPTTVLHVRGKATNSHRAVVNSFESVASEGVKIDAQRGLIHVGRSAGCAQVQYLFASKGGELLPRMSDAEIADAAGANFVQYHAAARERVRLRPINLTAVDGTLVLAIDHDRCLADLLRPKNTAQVLPALCEYVEATAQGRRVVVHSFSNRVSDAFNLCRRKEHFPTNLEALRELTERVAHFGLEWCATDGYELEEAAVAALLPDDELRAEYAALCVSAAEAVAQRRAVAFDAASPLTQAINALQSGTELKARVASAIRARYAGDEAGGSAGGAAGGSMGEGGAANAFLFLDDKLENLHAVGAGNDPAVVVCWFWPTQIVSCRMGSWTAGPLMAAARRDAMAAGCGDVSASEQSVVAAEIVRSVLCATGELPASFDFEALSSKLPSEDAAKLCTTRPQTLLQASRIPGGLSAEGSHALLSALSVHLESDRNLQHARDMIHVHLRGSSLADIAAASLRVESWEKMLNSGVLRESRAQGSARDMLAALDIASSTESSCQSSFRDE